MHTHTLFDERVGLSMVLYRSAWAGPARTDVHIQAATMSLLNAKMEVIWTLPVHDCLQIGWLGGHIYHQRPSCSISTHLFDEMKHKRQPNAQIYS